MSNETHTPILEHLTPTTFTVLSEMPNYADATPDCVCTVRFGGLLEIVRNAIGDEPAVCPYKRIIEGSSGRLIMVDSVFSTRSEPSDALSPYAQ